MADYDEDQVRRFLPVLWNEELRIKGVRSETAPEPGARTGYQNPAHAGTNMCVTADLQRAWSLADLTLRQKQIIFMRYGLMWEQHECADHYGINRSNVSRTEQAGVNHLLDFLNTGQSTNRTFRTLVRGVQVRQEVAA